ncbi:MAG TPA: cytochrome c [Vicinamibacterales bacterium]|nr:cytochrome c [Vicinamibacterales bacterium]
MTAHMTNGCLIMNPRPKGLIRAGLAIALLSGLYFGSVSPLAQTSKGAVVSTAIVNGRAIFRQYCAVCHGAHGTGHGPAAHALTPRPTDLTKLTRRAGTFPAAHVTAVLNGTAPVVAHGVPAMMVWGTLFLADANGSRVAADARLSDVVQFIASIQENN